MSISTVDAAQAGSSSRPSAPSHPAIETGALVALGVAFALYLLHSLPTMFAPTGVLSTFLTLMLGVLLGLGAAAGALAFAFYRVTHPKPGSSKHAADQLQPSHSRRRHPPPAVSSAGGAATAPGPTLPHATAVSGEFSGIVYTLPQSQWSRQDTVGNWPPTSDPGQGRFQAWNASLAHGTLVLRPILPPPGAKPPSPAQAKQSKLAAAGGAAGSSANSSGSSSSSAASQALAPAAGLSVPAGPAAGPGAAEAAAAPHGKVGIPLEGCTVELVADGLKGRSEFIRRAPLLISHDRWSLLDGEQAFYLWADDPASKQQWTYALGWWCQQGEKLRAVQQMYAAYCLAMTDRSMLEYPQQALPVLGGSGSSSGRGAAAPGSALAAAPLAGSEAGAAQAGGAGGGGEVQAGKRGWKGWGSKVHTMKRKLGRKGEERPGTDSRGGSPPSGLADQQAAPGAASAAGGGVGVPAADGGGLAAAELESLEGFIDAKWMQSRRVQMPPTIPEAIVRSRQGSKATSPRAIPRTSFAAERSYSSASASGSGSVGLGSSGGLAGWQGTQSFNAGTVYGGGSIGGSGSGFLTPSLGAGSPEGRPALGPAAAAGAAPAHGWQGGGGVRRWDSSPAPFSSAAAAALLPPGSPLGGGMPPPGQHRVQVSSELDAHPQQQQQQAGASGSGEAAAPEAAPLPTPAAAAAQSAAGEACFKLPAGLPPLISPDYAMNAFITRCAFDVLRRPDFQENVRARIQRQLCRLQRPDYIQSLEVVGVDCGSTAPSLCNWRALPQPGAAIWPQLLFDMRYQGSFSITIEMKVDIRDAAAWGKLDQALTRLAEGKHRQGSPGGSGEADSPSQQSFTSPGPHASSSVHGSAGGTAEDEDGGGEELEPLSPDSPSIASEQDAFGAHQGGSGGRRGLMGGIRQKAANKLRQLAESTAAHISKIPLRLSLTFSLLEGTMCAWVPPPPGNRLFYAFVSPPQLDMSAKPELAGRFLKYSYHIARVSSWIEQRMRNAITKNIVFPGGGDIPLLLLMGLDHPNAADSLPGLGEYMRQVAADADAEPKRSRRQEKKQERQEQKQEKQEHKLEKKQEKQEKKLEHQQEKQEHKLEKKQEKQEHKQEKEDRKQEKKQEREKDREEEKQRQRQQLEVMRQQQQEQQQELRQQELRHGTVTVAALVSEPRVNVASLGLSSPDAAHLAVPAGGREAAQQLPQPSVLALARTVADQTAAADHQPDAAAAPPPAAVAPGASPPPAVAPAPAPPSAAAAQQQLFPEAHAPAAAASNAVVNGWRRSTGGSSSQQEELAGEPSLSLPHSLRPSASEEAAGLEGPAAHTATAAAEHTSSRSNSSEGHLISQRYGGTAASGQSGLQQLATGPPVPDFQPQRQAAASAAAQSSWRASASDAFDAALAVEAPTPKFASKPWQQRQQQPQQQQQQPQQQKHDLQRRPVASGPLGGGAAVPTPPPLQAQQRQQAERQGMAVGEAPQQRPALQLRLSASRSLDPDFTTSAEHTRFGEAPPAALPNYGGSSSGSRIRRTLSARADNSSSPAGSLRGADVGESLSRSLAYLKRQSSLQHSPGEQSDQEDAAAGEGRQAAGTLRAEQQQQAVQQQAVQQQAVQQQAVQQEQAVQRQQTSPPAANGDQPRRLRQQGSLKEQAGRFFKQAKSNVKEASKALATQVHHMQQQRAEQRAGAGLVSRSNSSSSSRGPSMSPAASAVREEIQGSPA